MPSGRTTKKNELSWLRGQNSFFGGQDFKHVTQVIFLFFCSKAPIDTFFWKRREDGGRELLPSHPPYFLREGSHFWAYNFLRRGTPSSLSNLPTHVFWGEEEEGG